MTAAAPPDFLGRLAGRALGDGPAAGITPRLASRFEPDGGAPATVDPEMPAVDAATPAAAATRPAAPTEPPRRAATGPEDPPAARQPPTAPPPSPAPAVPTPAAFHAAAPVPAAAPPPVRPRIDQPADPAPVRPLPPARPEPVREQRVETIIVERVAAPALRSTAPERIIREIVGRRDDASPAPPDPQAPRAATPSPHPGEARPRPEPRRAAEVRTVADAPPRRADTAPLGPTPLPRPQPDDRAPADPAPAASRPEPVVHVTIGRVEVRAILDQPATRRAPGREPPRPVPLDQLLGRRGRTP